MVSEWIGVRGGELYCAWSDLDAIWTHRNGTYLFLSLWQYVAWGFDRKSKSRMEDCVRNDIATDRVKWKVSAPSIWRLLIGELINIINNYDMSFMPRRQRRGINPLRLQYVILRTKSQNRCDYCTYIYTYTDFAIEIWGFYRRLKYTLRYHSTRCSRDFGLQLAAIL